MTSGQEDSLHRMNFEQNMTCKIHWLQRAAKDFDDIYLYYKQVAGDSVAKRRITKILQATNNLRHLPNIGHLTRILNTLQAIVIYWCRTIGYIIS